MNSESQGVKSLDLLTRREVEARIVSAVLEGFTEELPEAKAHRMMAAVIKNIARKQGSELAKQWGGDTLKHYARVLDIWKAGGALELTMVEQTRNRLYFNVTRCKYAELYKAMGIAELGSILSCSRDSALAIGFNPRIKLYRTQTIMEDADFCDFRYVLTDSAETE